MTVAAVEKPKGPKGLFAKIAAVMAKVSRIPKAGHNVQQGYKYATEADIADSVRSAMAEVGLVMMPSFAAPTFRTVKAKDRELTICTVLGTFTFADAETGETAVSVFPGEGMDSGDKAIYKAMTGAEKYALLKTFLLSSGDDAEKDGSPDDAPTPVQAARTQVRAAAQQLGGTVEEKVAVLAQARGEGPSGFIVRFGKYKGQPLSAVPRGEVEGLAKYFAKSAADPTRLKYRDENIEGVRECEKQLRWYAANPEE
jgi:hypothetical protein